MLLSPQLLCLLGLMALGTGVHASPSAELKLERGSCPVFWFSFNGRCYKYQPTRVTWHNAEKNCHSEDARLVSIHSDEENTFVRALIQNYKPSERATWIGLHDLFFEGGWLWSDGSDVNYTKWLKGEPSGGATDNCGYTYLAEWRDLPCSHAPGIPSVCVLRT